MGVAWGAVAVPFESNLGRWSMYARDAFLVTGARLFGMTIRGVHPPEAARGLPDSPEFGQHFDASYRPLVHRALEHGQPVLAWQGWPGADAVCWGEIVDTSDEGIGLRGRVHAPSEAPTTSADVVTLVTPPVQLYVVETLVHRTPEASECLDTARSNARRVLGNDLTDRFGVVSGPTAYDSWIKRLSDSDATASHDRTLAEHRCLAGSLIEGYGSVIRFLESVPAPQPEPKAGNGGTSSPGLALRCRDVVTALTAASECGGVRDMIVALREAQAATVGLAAR